MKKRRFTQAQMVAPLREADRGTVADSRASTRSTNSEWDDRACHWQQFGDGIRMRGTKTRRRGMAGLGLSLEAVPRGVLRSTVVLMTERV
jgi:hypothetical protein